MSARALRTSVIVAVASFVALGISESGLGTAWPSMRVDVGRPIEDLGTLLVAGLAAYASSSAISGRVTEWIGSGPTFVVAGASSLAGLLVYAAATEWAGVMLAAVIVGIGGGLLDSAMNAVAAHHFSPGQMNLLHGGFGVGATLGPLVMAGAVAMGPGWRAGYLVYAAVQGVMLVWLSAYRRRWPQTDLVSGPRPTARIDLLASLTLLMFFLYTGLEVAAGAWSFSVLTEARGLATGTAGAWVSAYWAGLTVGRLGLSAVASRLGPHRVLGASMVGSVAGAAVFWWNPDGLGLIGLPLLGVSLAGIFPTLVTLTPERLGRDRTNAMVGYQLAAASLGAAALPWLVGRGVAATSLEALGPMLFVATVLMAALHVVLERRAGRQAPANVGDA